MGRKKAEQPALQYDKHKEAVAQRQADASEVRRDISPIPEIKNKDRRNSCERDLKLFCETYFKQAFCLPWSQNHYAMIERLEAVVFDNALYAEAMPRGTGKTTLAWVSTLFATLYAHQLYVFLIAATDPKARKLLSFIKTSLRTNQLLMSDFPEVCYPIKMLENITQRSSGQICDGRTTAMKWDGARVIYPTIKGSKSSGVIFETAGLLSGQILGAQHLKQNGVVQRPTLVLLDDPQTPESAKSLMQTEKRMEVITHSVMGLGGPTRKVAIAMPCTVIAEGDVSDQLTDRKKSPEWHGHRTKTLLSFPDDLSLWEEYWTIRADELANSDTCGRSNQFYLDRRDAMDMGCEITWKERYDEKEISAIQAAMNEYLRDPGYFFAQLQNEPMSDMGGSTPITKDDVIRKINNRKRGSIPTSCNTITAFIDVQDTLLYWLVTAWTDKMTGFIMDYGSFPQQGIPYFTLRNAQRTIQRTYPGKGKKACWYMAIRDVTETLCSKKYFRDDGIELTMNRLFVDANDGEAAPVIYQYTKEAKHRGIIMPYRSQGIGAASLPFSDYSHKKGDKVGHRWKIMPTHKDRSVRYILNDVNYWKSTVRDAWKTGQGDDGSMSVFGDNDKMHRMLIDQMVAEYPIKTEGRGRVVEEWKLRRGRPDNHFFDCLVGTMVGASERGCALPSTGPAMKRRKKRKYVKMSDLQKARRNRS